MSTAVVPSGDTEEIAPTIFARTRSLRVSVTDRCNFRCRYCMPQEGIAIYQHSDLPSLEELSDLVSWLTRRLAIERVRLTGGEPLVRRGIEHLVAALSSMESIKEVSLTTNAALLSRFATSLRAAGLKRVNISLDSIDPQRFSQITRGGSLNTTLEGIRTALDAGLTPVKLNAVIQRSTWMQDVPLLLDFAAANHLEIRFIELMRTGTERQWCESEFVSTDEVRVWLKKRCDVTSLEISSGAPARQCMIQWNGVPLMTGWISPRSHPFCSCCGRLRLDARGRIFRCLMDPVSLDLRALLASKSSGEAEDEFYAYLLGKSSPRAMDIRSSMSLIGG